MRREGRWRVFGPAPLAESVKQLMRRTIALRSSTEAVLEAGRRRWVVGVSAQGPDRAICVVRRELADRKDDDPDSSGEDLQPRLDRCEFLRRFRASMSLAALCEHVTCRHATASAMTRGKSTQIDPQIHCFLDRDLWMASKGTSTRT